MITGGLLSAGSKLAMSRTRVATPTLTPGDQTRVTMSVTMGRDYCGSGTTSSRARRLL